MVRGGTGAAQVPRPHAGAGLDWPQYLHDPQHSSMSTATAFAPTNAA